MSYDLRSSNPDPFYRGWHIAIGGPLFAQKTTIGILRMSHYANCKVYKKKGLIIVAKTNTRYPTNEGLLNHNGTRVDQNIPCVMMSLDEILQFDYSNYDMVLFDELHIELLKIKMDTGLDRTSEVVNLIHYLTYQKHMLTIACMNNFWGNGEPVQLFLELSKIASETPVLTSRCDLCGRHGASMSQLIHNNDMASSQDDSDDGSPKLVVSGKQDWHAVCGSCWSGAPVYSQNERKQIGQP